MKKLIAMIGVGAALCFAPSCKKSPLTPVNENNPAVSNSLERVGPQTPSPVVEGNTSLFVMLGSMPCANPEKQYTSMMLDIEGVRVYNPSTGWQSLKTVTSGWDLVYMQQGTQPGWNITERTVVNPGSITQLAITFGDRNRLVVNNQPASCFKLASREVFVNVRGDVKKGAVNELKLSVDVCGHISVQEVTDGSKCYVLKPDIQFQQLTQEMVK